MCEDVGSAARGGRGRKVFKKRAGTGGELGGWLEVGSMDD